MTEKNKIIYPDIKQSWGIVGMAVLSMILFSPVNLIMENIVGKEMSFLIYYLLAMGVPFFVANRLRKKKTGASVYNFDFGTAKIIVLVSITIIAIQMGIVSPVANLIPMPEIMKDLFLELANQNGVFSFMAIVIAAPILEELIFRGIILNGLLKKYSPIKSIIVSSVLFGIVHLNPWQFVSASIIGLFSGWIYYKTQKLTLSIIIHMVNNLFAFISMYVVDMETMMNQSISEFYGSLTNYLMIATAAIIIAAIGVFLIAKEFKNTEMMKWQCTTWDTMVARQ